MRSNVRHQSAAAVWAVRPAIALGIAGLLAFPTNGAAAPFEGTRAPVNSQASLFHSPGDDGLSSSVPLIPPDGSQMVLHLWLSGGPTASVPGDACSYAATGDEVCGWDVQISGTGAVTLSDFVSTADVVHNLTFGTQLRANGGEFDAPMAVPERIGALTLTASGAGSVVLDGNIFVTSSLQQGVIATGLLATTNADEADLDGDGLASASDNCTLLWNPDQRDTNGDGYGNACDADVNDDGIVNVVDLGLLKLDFFATGDLHTDFNGDAVVNAIDLGVLKAGFFAPPGPSGLATRSIYNKDTAQ